MSDLDSIEKAVRNIAQGKNAQTFIIGRIQARIVKTLMEEGIMPMQLIQKGIVHPLENMKELEEKKFE